METLAERNTTMFVHCKVMLLLTEVAQSCCGVTVQEQKEIQVLEVQHVGT